MVEIVVESIVKVKGSRLASILFISKEGKEIAKMYLTEDQCDLMVEVY